MNRGDIYYTDLNRTIGSEQAGLRPVVILQNDTGNEYSPTVIVAPITSKINSKALIPTHVFIKPLKNNGLKQNSIVLTEQIRTIDKMRLDYYIGKLNDIELHSIDKALIISLGIDIELSIIYLHNLLKKLNARKIYI